MKDSSFTMPEADSPRGRKVHAALWLRTNYAADTMDTGSLPPRRRGLKLVSRANGITVVVK